MKDDRLDRRSSRHRSSSISYCFVSLHTSSRHVAPCVESLWLWYDAGEQTHRSYSSLATAAIHLCKQCHLILIQLQPTPEGLDLVVQLLYPGFSVGLLLLPLP